MVTTSEQLPPKKDVMLALLEQSSVFIHLDPRKESVRVPPWFKKQPQLVLQVGLNMAVRIPDLAVEDEAVSCTLSFSRSPFFCYMPWSSVFALVGEDGKGMLWPDDLPPEVLAQQAERAQKERVREQAREKVFVVESGEKPAPAELRAAKARVPKREPSETAPDRAPAGTPAGIVGTGPTKKPARGESARKSPATPSAERESKRPLPPYLRIVK